MADQAHKALTYFVNGERQTTRDDDLAVRQVLTAAGFTPVEQYRLTRDAGNHVYTNYDETIEVHEDERFTATYIGPTPTS